MPRQGNDGAFRERFTSEQHVVQRFDTLDEAVKEAEYEVSSPRFYVIQRGEQYQVIEGRYLFHLPADTPIIAHFTGLVTHSRRWEIGCTIAEHRQRALGRYEEREASAQELPE